MTRNQAATINTRFVRLHETGKCKEKPAKAHGDSILGGELELLARNSAQLEKPNQSFLDQVVGTRRAGGDADDGGARRKPEVRNHFAFFGQIVMLDFIAREKPRSVQDKIGRQFFLAHFREVRSVRAVVTANNKEQIHFDVE